MSIPLYLTGYVSAFSTVLVALVTLFSFNKKHDVGATIFRAYFFIAAITEIGMLLYIVVLGNSNNMQLANTFCLVQFFMVYLALTSWLPNNKIKKVLYYFLAVIMIMLIAYFISIFSFHFFDSFSTAIESLFLTILSVYILYHLTSDHSDYLYRNYKFWFAVAVFIYFSVSTIVFATGNYVLNNNLFLRNYTWIINSFLTIFTNILYIKGLLCLMKNKQ